MSHLFHLGNCSVQFPCTQIDKALTDTPVNGIAIDSRQVTKVKYCFT